MAIAVFTFTTTATSTPAQQAGLQGKPVQLSVGTGVGQLAPDFELKSFDGKDYKLSRYRGEKGVVVNFFATWCPHCNAEAPRLESLYSKYNTQVEFLSVDDSQEDAGRVRQFYQAHSISFPLLLDPNVDVTRAYSVRAQPYSLFVDKEGVIKAVKYGENSPDDLEQFLKLII